MARVDTNRDTKANLTMVRLLCSVYTITSKQELEELMKELNQQGAYEQYIVQSLIGNYSWSSVTRHGQYFHVGTVRSASVSFGPRAFC